MSVRIARTYITCTHTHTHTHVHVHNVVTCTNRQCEVDGAVALQLRHYDGVRGPALGQVLQLCEVVRCVYLDALHKELLCKIMRVQF